MMRRWPAARRGFVLLEVILSLLILGVAVAAFMRSFTQSLSAARRMEVQTQAASLGEELLQQLEVQHPAEGVTQGKFEAPNDKYSYLVEMSYEKIDYGKLDGDDQIEQFFPLMEVEITIDFDDGVRPAFQALRLTSAVPCFEKFTFNSKQSYANF